MPKPWERYQSKPWEQYQEKTKAVYTPTPYEEMIKAPDINISESLRKYGVQPTAEILAAIKGAEMGAKIPGTPITKALGGVVGSGLGYALGRQIDPKQVNKPMGETLMDIPGQVATGAAMEVGAQAIPAVMSGARKVPGLIKSGFQKMLSKPRQVGQSVESATDALAVLKAEREAFKPTLETEAANLKYAEQGLADLTPVQMQPKVMGEPTPAQYTEALLKARDPKLYQQQVDQVNKYQQALKEFQEMGASTQEVAGQQIKEGLAKAKGRIGETVGDFYKAGESIPLGKTTTKTVTKQVKPDFTTDFPAASPEITKVIKETAQVDLPLLKPKGLDAKALEDFKPLIEHLNNKVATSENIAELMVSKRSINEAAEKAYNAGDKNLSRILGDWARDIESFSAGIVEKAGVTKPKEAFDAYSKISGMAKDTLRGVEKTGQSKNVIKKITSSGESIKQFKETAKAMGEPELVTQVKENWLSNLFNEATETNPGKWITKWQKAKKEGIVKELLSTEQINKINTLEDYYIKMSSTTTRTVNPSRTGILGFAGRVASQPWTTMVKYILGDEMKYAKALSDYRKIAKSRPGMSKITPSRSALPYAIGTQNKD